MIRKAVVCERCDGSGCSACGMTGFGVYYAERVLSLLRDGRWDTDGLVYQRVNGYDGDDTWHELGIVSGEPICDCYGFASRGWCRHTLALYLLRYQPRRYQLYCGADGIYRFRIRGELLDRSARRKLRDDFVRWIRADGILLSPAQVWFKLQRRDTHEEACNAHQHQSGACHQSPHDP